jgi:hypothetical protein
MSSFFFNRRPAAEESKIVKPKPPGPSGEALKESGQVQAVTASAIFAMLVSKGILSAEEAACYMEEIGRVIERDIPGPTGTAAGDMLRSYGRALVAADA